MGRSTTAAGDYRQLLRERILDVDELVKATFSGQQRGQTLPWTRVVLRPVIVKERKQIQFSYFDEKRDTTKNYAGREAESRLDELLALPFRNYHVATTAEEVQVNISQKGTPLISRSRAGRQGPDLAHNRQKQHVLPEGRPDPFLKALGIMAEDGKIKAGMHGKFNQINEFLKLVDLKGELEGYDKSPLQVVDFGCGSGYLTFAAYHYLNHVLGRPAEMVGVDLKSDLLAAQAEKCAALGWQDLTFQASPIGEYNPATPPDIVLALHACNTATDDALAQGIRWQSKLIFSAPCCHHHLQEQLQRQGPAGPFAPVFRHGILRERLGDILTDSFRALILRIMGYRADVVEFVSSEHTAKNLLIRAVRKHRTGDAAAVREYDELKAFWGVRPYLEELLGDDLARVLRPA